ncbi:MAG: META domain-containing protein [Chloroflexi bacterium]|nr:META domain-containing protein [Chloroflexota bacterium]
MTNIPWQWVSTTDPKGSVTVNDPSRYVILFNDDNSAFIKADCNNARATYVVDGSNISIAPGATTMMACPDDSLDSVFLQQLSSGAIYFMNGGNLFMDLPARQRHDALCAPRRAHPFTRPRSASRRSG